MDERSEEDKREKSLEERRDEIKKRLSRVERVRRATYGFAAIIIIGAGVLAFLWSGPDAPFNGSLFGSPIQVLGFGALYAATGLVAGLTLPIKQLRDALVDIENDIDLLSMSSQSHEQKAQKRLRIQQLELKRYYDQTLKQSSGIFVVGVLAMIMGFVVIIGTLYYVGYDFLSPTRATASNQAVLGEKIVVATVGAVGGILTNFIGALYIKMFSGIVTAASQSQTSLVNLHHLHMAHLITATITNDDLRQKTLSELALSLKPSAAPGTAG